MSILTKPPGPSSSLRSNIAYDLAGEGIIQEWIILIVVPV